MELQGLQHDFSHCFVLGTSSSFYGPQNMNMQSEMPYNCPSAHIFLHDKANKVMHGCQYSYIAYPCRILGRRQQLNLSAAEIRCIHQRNCESVRLQEVRRQAREDSDCHQLKQHIMEGFPHHQRLLQEAIKPF